MKPVIIIQNCGAESAGTIVDFLSQQSIGCRLIRTFAGDSLPPLEESGPLISLGCPESVTVYQNSDYLKRLYAHVSEAVRVKHAYLGICFGGQLLAQIMGANVGPNDVPKIGVYNVRLTDAGKSDPLWAGFPDRFPVFHWHADRFRVPFGHDLLVEGDDCKYQAFRSGNAVALQFHLEPTPDEVGQWCDVYAEELSAFGSDKETIINQIDPIAPELLRLNSLLLKNFLSLAK